MAPTPDQMLKLAKTGVNLEFSAQDYVPMFAIQIVQTAVAAGANVRIRDAGRYVPDQLHQLAGAGGKRLTIAV